MLIGRLAALALLAAATSGPPALAQVAPAESALSAAMRDQRLRDFMGRPVYSADGVRFGDVGALVVDRRTRGVIAALVRYGGIFGAFANEILVPVDQIAIVNIDSLVLLWTAAEVAAVPPVDAGRMAAAVDLLMEE